MKRGLIIFLAGILAGFALGRIGPKSSELFGDGRITPRPSSICYSCAWEGIDPSVRNDLIGYYRQYFPADKLLLADARFALWRTTGTPNCDMLKEYRQVASASDSSPFRRYVAETVVGFAGPECGEDTHRHFHNASKAAAQAGLPSEALLLDAMANGDPSRVFGDVEVRASLTVPPGAKNFVLGESAVQITPGMRIGTQVDRVMRDWISAQLKWSASDDPAAAALIGYHEGALAQRIIELAGAKIYPMAGSLAARKNDKWYAPDDTGTFRFQVLDDKMRYPTTHAVDDVGWIEDTHGISALVPQAVERHMQLVIGCGDSTGKMKAAYYLAQKGINVFVPGDRYQDELLGYDAPGMIIGGAPVHKKGEAVVIGGQPVQFLVAEPIVVEDTKKAFPIQYYDAPARYFRALNRYAPLRLTFVEVDEPGQIGRVLIKAEEMKASAVAIRVMTQQEDIQVRDWLQGSKTRRAILFHSALYPFAQLLFSDFPSQVTFGDLHPRFK
ncbi:MAG: hypothetical protein JWN45_1853 [Acidobacteriaceae bacterium]|nr:hypothetical protein [Acidobacteriaceae bacterium]